MFLYYLATFFYGSVFLFVFGASAFIAHSSSNPRFIAAWWLGILLHILFPLAFMTKTENGYVLNLPFEEIDTESMLLVFIVEFTIGITLMWLFELVNTIPEKILAIIYSVISYSSVYALLMMYFLKNGGIPFFWLSGFVISILFYISFISKDPNNFVK